MNSQVLMGLAVVLIAGAGMAGYWGLTLSREPQAPPAEPVAEQEAVVVQPEKPAVAELRADVIVLARDIPAFSKLTETDLVVEKLRVAPPGSYSDTSALIGRQIWRDLPAGTVLNEGSFNEGGPLARMIRPGERAVPVKIDEVVAAGGHLRPGDYVDVLLFLKSDGQNTQRSAQVAVPALRVLSVGDDIGMDLSGEPVATPADDGDKRAQRPRVARSAVLAVPDALVTRFTLASQVGSLRLAVRSAEEKRLAAFYAGEPGKIEEINRQLFRFEKFMLSPAAAKPAGIQVFRGSIVSRENP